MKGNISFYMVAERGFQQKVDVFDCLGKSFEDFHLDFVNQSTYTALAGKSDAERNAVAAMTAALEASANMSMEQAKNLVHTGNDDEKKQTKGAN